jgi:archaellum component FlaC
MALVVSG